jgi:hypothetical protein
MQVLQQDHLLKLSLDLKSTNTVAASGLFDGPVTDKLGTGTDWYHCVNSQNSTVILVRFYGG